ncbi:MAG: hypothetical protein DHS20C14_06750 [Phycisphaeraceae bacterium]|nr:MAG: hypothetical protein DHS20C14_06750 [Phycisphaeraceae bacterium]
MDALGSAERAAAGKSLEAELGAETAGLARVIAQLDALGSAEAREPSDGFEARLVDSVAEVFAPAPIRFLRSHRVGAVGGLGIAAAIVLATGLFTVRPMSRTADPADPPAFAQVSLEEDVDLLLEMYETDAWATELADLRTEADSVDDALDAPWSAYETLTNGAS